MIGTLYFPFDMHCTFFSFGSAALRYLFFLQREPQNAPFWTDDRLLNSDEQHEDQPVWDPQIALALLSRTLHEHVALADALNVTISPETRDAAQNLTKFNQADGVCVLHG